MTMHMKKRTLVFLSVLFSVILALLTSCGDAVVEMTPREYLSQINTLVDQNFGGISVTETIDVNTTVSQISDNLYLTLAADPVTGLLLQAELALYMTPDTGTLDHTLFEHYFLVLLKAHDPDISVANLNAVHDALGIEDYTLGTDTKIGYGSNTYFYTVGEDMALFTAQFRLPSETLSP